MCGSARDTYVVALERSVVQSETGDGLVREMCWVQLERCVAQKERCVVKLQTCDGSAEAGNVTL
jgi:hypothetical protein